jgi:hypothetical protein
MKLVPAATGGRVCGIVAWTAIYTAGMGDDAPASKQGAGRDDVRALPEHLSAVVGSLHGPEDLGRNHDKYLTYPDRDDADGAASA